MALVVASGRPLELEEEGLCVVSKLLLEHCNLMNVLTLDSRFAIDMMT